MEAADPTWRILLSAAALADGLEREGRPELFGATGDGALEPRGDENRDTVLAWRPGAGWERRLPPQDPRAATLDLYLPICRATRAHPITIGHLGQSLDGFIATLTGDSQFITGAANIVHLHRMRALCDAVIVGAGTVAADDPQLTTRHVSGDNAVRVVFDPTRRLASTFKVFSDGEAATLYVCGRSLVGPGETHVGAAAIVPFDDTGPEQDVRHVLDILRARGCARIFVEGGGVTVSAFLEANLLDRLQMAIAPLLIGDGRPAIRLAPHANLRDCRRPRYRVFRMGGDVLFDCDLRAQADDADLANAETITRVI